MRQKSSGRTVSQIDSQRTCRNSCERAKASGNSLSRGLALNKASLLWRLCYRSLSHNSLCLLFDLSNTNRTGADVCAYFPVVLCKHTPSLITLSLMVLLHVSHRYLTVRGLRALRDAKMLECKHKTSSQTTFPFNYRHPGLALCFYTWFKLDLIILALS